MKRRKAIFICGLVFLLVFAGFSKLVKQNRLKDIDFATSVKIQDNMPARFDELWEDVAFFVTPVPSIFLVGLLTVAALVDVKNKRIRLRALIIPLLFTALVFGEIYGKNVVHHPAPPFFMIKNPTTIFPTYYINEQYSYPSGHTARAVFMGLVLFTVLIQVWPQFKKKTEKRVLIAVGVLLYVTFIAIGRIYLGHHWLSDIMGGALLGGGIGLWVLVLVL